MYVHYCIIRPCTRCSRRRTLVLWRFFYICLLLFISDCWTELSQHLPYVWKWVRIKNACPKFGVSPPPKNWGSTNSYFRRFSTTLHLNGKFGQRLHKQTTYNSNCHELWSTNGLKLDRSFYPTSLNSALYFIARLSTWRSANGTRPDFAKW